jgi:heat shock protein HslJ
MKRLRRVLVGTIAGVILLGCATMGLEDIRWSLVELDGMPVVAAAEDRRAFIVFEGRDAPRVSGSTGCNRFTGSYARGQSRLSFGPIASTKMACPDDMAQEQAFLQALQAVSSWRRLDGILELLDDQGTVRLRFESARP